MVKKTRMNIDMRKIKGSRLIVVDVNAVMHTNFVPLKEPESGEDAFKKSNPYSKFQKRELSWEVDGEKVNTSSLYALFRLFQTFGFNHHYVFCFDAPKNQRRQEDATYKAGRAKKHKELIDQLNLAYELLDAAGYTTHKYEGFEADDFVVETVNQNKEFFDHVFVVSNDFDMGQNVDDNVYFKNVVKKHGDITKENYEEMLGCPYNSVLLYKAMVGDKSDNFKGIYRFGPKKFYQFLEDEGIQQSLPEIRKKRGEYAILKNSAFLNEEQRGEAIRSLMKAVPRLPDDYKDMSITQNVNKEMLEFFLEKYGMKSIIKVLNKG